MNTEAESQVRIAMLEAQLRAVSATVPILMLALDARGVVTMAQGQLLASLGFTPEQVIGQPVQEIYSELPDVMADIRRALTGETFTSVSQVGPLTLQVTYTPYFDGVVSVAIDITQSKRAEQAAQQQQQEFLTKVINALPVRVFWKNADLVYEGCNQVFAEDAGLTSPQDIVGRDDYSMGWAEQADLYRADDQAVIDSGQPRLNFEEPQSRPDGSTGWLRTSKVPLYDADGVPAGVMGVYEDITQWKQAQISLREQQEFLHKVIDALPARVFWKDAANLTYLGCNQAFAQDSGLAEPDQLVGKTDFEMAWADQADLYRADDRAVLKTGQARINFEEPQSRADGSTGWLRTSKIPLYSTDGAITGVLGVYEDITDSKHVEAERERLQQQVIEAQRQALADLSSPIIPIMDSVIVLPLVGSIDTARSRDIMRALLGGISQYRAKVVILDITGVPIVDSSVADHLNHTIQAARLKGAHTIVTGISDAVAETIVDLGIDWTQVETLTDLQSGLIAALARMGVRLTTSSRADSRK